jgi:hypothetical protein
MDKKEKFILKAQKRYNDEYDYSRVNYTDSLTRVNIVCKKHGVSFNQVPSEHLRGKIGCNECSGVITYTTESFINKAKTIHGDRYDYSLVKYVNAYTKLKLICNIHGEFEQLPNNHLTQNCPKCSHRSNPSYTLKDFINKAKLVHGDKYSYENSIYSESKNKIKIICDIHGEFEQIASNHLRGKGCSKCAKNISGNKLRFNTNIFIDKSNLIHKNKYDYSNSIYTDSNGFVEIICPKHGSFKQKAYYHLAGHGCNDCTSTISELENEISSFLIDNNIEVITSSRSIIKPNQLDIYIPSHNLAIEFNGLYWHSEEYLAKNYHLNKTELCEAKDIQLIHIFEDEWLNKRPIVESRLKNILGLTPNKIYARKTHIKEVSSKDVKVFLNANHIQGNVNSSIKIGLYLDEELVSLMTFGGLRRIIGSTEKEDSYELLRFCNKLNSSVIGGAGKLLKYFEKHYNPKEIVSYADRRWSKGNLYNNLGFKFIHYSQPNYWYVINKKRVNRINFQKHKLIKEGYNKDKTEHQIMLDRKIYRIYDCGTITYRLKP